MKIRRLPAAMPRRRQAGVSLAVTLLMLTAVMLLGVSAAQIALQGEKSLRNARDREIAFQAAEAALMDAELDIQKSPYAGRSSIFSKDSAVGFNSDSTTPCSAGDVTSTGDTNLYLGLCAHRPPGAVPAWQLVDFTDNSIATEQSVPLGKFTGQPFMSGLSLGSLPIAVPRYVIELMLYNPPGQSADAISYFYRITAVGFGVRATTQVVLQSLYRKDT